VKEQVFPGSVYGEITLEGTKKIINIFNEEFNNPNGVFYDLGSGKGDLVINISKLTKIGKVCGIELHKNRFDTSLDKLSDSNLKNVTFLNNNFLNSNFSDATIIFFANEGIPREVSNEVWDMIPKGCLLICGRRCRAIENRGKYFKTENIEKTYTKTRGNWYIRK
jgi:precorrin-6B methylase 2